MRYRRNDSDLDVLLTEKAKMEKAIDAEIDKLNQIQQSEEYQFKIIKKMQDDYMKLKQAIKTATMLSKYRN